MVIAKQDIPESVKKVKTKLYMQAPVFFMKTANDAEILAYGMVAKMTMKRAAKYVLKPLLSLTSLYFLSQRIK